MREGAIFEGEQRLRHVVDGNGETRSVKILHAGWHWMNQYQRVFSGGYNGREGAWRPKQKWPFGVM